MTIDLQGGVIIRNVQRGSVSVGAGAAVNVPITSVNMAKTFVKINSLSDWGIFRAELTSPTNLRLTEMLGNAVGIIQWEVIEFM